MSDPTQAGQPSEEELRAYMEQLRTADAAEIVAQAFSMLASAAQVKLGRRDARVLIDSLAGLLQAAEATIDPKLASGMRSAVGQLQTAQVQAEQEEAGDEAAPQTRAAAAAGAGSRGEPPAPEQGGQRMTDRLWIPGRGQPPPG